MPPRLVLRGVWDADFDRGDFDRTDLIFGSGGRSRQTTVTFASSGATVDRLQFAVMGKRTFVSNSLPGLLEGIGARLDPRFRGYDEYFEQVILASTTYCPISRWPRAASASCISIISSGTGRR